MQLAGSRTLQIAVLSVLIAGVAPICHAANPGALEPVLFQNLTDNSISTMGEKALRINQDGWLHAETENFVYHYFNSFIATPVSVEAEFYYRVIADDLGKSTENWERKSHIFIFESDADWDAFKQGAALEPWTGGIHTNGELYIQRNPKYKYKGHTLGHEVVHLVIDRFLPGNLPVWLEEGYAEFASIIAYASFFRARGYQAKPVARAVETNYYIPLDGFFRMRSYPRKPAQVRAFYDQSHRMVRFLRATEQQAFLPFLESMAGGARVESALQRHYPELMQDWERFEKEFKDYATGN